MKHKTNVIPLRSAAELATVGGKAANLARLIAVGAPVPDGFVLTNTALQHFVAEQEALPPDVDLAVLEGWRSGFADGPVVVRSSAVGEDSQDASFAGQLDSVLNVTTADSLRRAILQVWASQWSPRVLAYQSSRNTYLHGMGVVVQRQVDAAVSGVLFTASPNAASQMLLEYCEGLGDTLVAGEVNPGRVTINRADLTWTRVAAPEEATAAEDLLLNDHQIATLGRLALRIEQAFGGPQDLEWTIDRSGRCWIVQTRPITVTGFGTATTSDGPGVLWTNANVNENFPQPICPLLYSIARVGYYHYFRNLGRAFGISEQRLTKMEPALRQIIGVHGARMYYNLTNIHTVLRTAPFGRLLAASFDQFTGAEQDGKEKARVGAAESRVARVRELAVIAAKTTWQYLFLTRRVEQFEARVDAFAKRTHPAALAGKRADGLLEDFRGFLHIRYHGWKDASLADAGSMVCYGALQRFLASAFPGEDQQAFHNTLLKALPDLVSSVPPLKLWELSRMVNRDPALRELFSSTDASTILSRIGDSRFAEFRTAFEAFLENWGFRCSAELMLTIPSFQENPEPVIELLKAYAARDGESPADQLRRQADGRVRDTAAMLSILRRRPVARFAPFVRQSTVAGILLRWTQRSIQLRERARLKQALLYSRLRRISLALGARLSADGRLAQAEDLFYLTADEVDLLVSGGEMFPGQTRELVTLRRRAHDELSAQTPPDSMRLQSGAYLDASPAPRSEPCGEASDALTGVGACGGRTTARAAILLDVTQSHRLNAGDILVTRQTDPGWGPIFPLISGLVIERGGMLSHGAIIAREFGIPSVVGVKDATRRIQHGGSITVDGDRGLVHVVAGGGR
jgi:pyruvate,water dikinase